jgi:hypothetical protein
MVCIVLASLVPTRLMEVSSLEFRFETFSTFNHAQFDGSGCG